MENGSSSNKKPKDKLKDGISKIQDTTRKLKTDVEDSIKSDTNYQIYSAIGYIPIIGWMLPYFFKKKSSDCQFHAKQSAVLAVIFIMIMTVVWILNHLPILSHLLSFIGIKSFLIPAITYSSSVLYIGVSLVSAYKAYNRDKWEIPFLPQIREFLSNLFKNDEKPGKVKAIK